MRDPRPSPLLGWEGRTACGPGHPRTPPVWSPRPEGGQERPETGAGERMQRRRRGGELVPDRLSALSGGGWGGLVPDRLSVLSVCAGPGGGGRLALPTRLKPLGVSAASPLNPKSPATPRNTGRAQRATQALGKPRRIPGPRGYSGGSLRGKGPRRAAQVWVWARHPRLGAAVKWRL